MITVGISSFTQERNSAKGRVAVTRRHIHYAQDVSAQRKTSLTFRFDRFYYGGDRREGAAESLNPHPILRMGRASRSPLPLAAERFRFLFLLAACTEPLVLSFPPKKKNG
jgi:hypothetical protein